MDVAVGPTGCSSTRALSSHCGKIARRACVEVRGIRLRLPLPVFRHRDDHLPLRERLLCHAAFASDGLHCSIAVAHPRPGLRPCLPLTDSNAGPAKTPGRARGRADVYPSEWSSSIAYAKSVFPGFGALGALLRSRK